MQQVCKCCGRTMEVSETAYTATCHFCGKQQTLPPCHTPKLRKQYAQIYALRQSGAFSAAIEQIEHLLHLYPEESEWYWQRLLCRYGMVYLPDIWKENIFPAMYPATGLPHFRRCRLLGCPAICKTRNRTLL